MGKERRDTDAFLNGLLDVSAKIKQKIVFGDSKNSVSQVLKDIESGAQGFFKLTTSNQVES